jgi:hypothetical protein
MFIATNYLDNASDERRKCDDIMMNGNGNIDRQNPELSSALFSGCAMSISSSNQKANESK